MEKGESLMLSRGTKVVAIIAACIMIVACFVVTPTAGVVNAAAKKKYVKSLNIAASHLNMMENDSVSIKYLVKSKGNVSKKIKVSSSNDEVADVEIVGNHVIIYGNDAGKAVITVKTKGKNKKGKAIVKKITVTVLESMDFEDLDDIYEEDEEIAEGYDVASDVVVTDDSKMIYYDDIKIVDDDDDDDDLSEIEIVDDDGWD